MICRGILRASVREKPLSVMSDIKSSPRFEVHAPAASPKAVKRNKHSDQSKQLTAAVVNYYILGEKQSATILAIHFRAAAALNASHNG